MSPKSDAFLTTSQDGSARLWDVRTNVCSGALRCTTANPVAAFDHQGLVFAVVTSDGVTKLFDARQYEQGPFDTYVFDAGVPAVRMPASASSVSFSLDGKQLLVCAGGHLHVMDAFNGQRLQCLPVPSSNAFGVNAAPLCEPCFTPDGRCVLSGAADGLIHGWNTASGVELQPPWRGHAGVPCCLKWSYSRALAASGCTAGGVALWIPPPPATEGHVGGAPQGLMQQAAQFPGQTGGLMAAMQPVMQQGAY
jgi:COMPASS component SWD2